MHVFHVHEGFGIHSLYYCLEILLLNMNRVSRRDVCSTGDNVPPKQPGSTALI